MLWFDVGIERYTTVWRRARAELALWFDVGIERYTTQRCGRSQRLRCGLM